jgi:putative DNA primase/helicase
MSLAEVARTWRLAGVSVVPILANQTKRPAVRWSAYQAVAPTLDEINEWWANGKPYGLALICGGVSGNLEMTEIEGRAITLENLEAIGIRMDEIGAGPVWDRLISDDGYMETSPSHGIHLLYRISDHEVPGNTKIAANEEGIVLAETRGHGGYVIVAPTTGACHPSGLPWQLKSGRYGHLPILTWEERNLLHEGLKLTLDRTPPPIAPATLPMNPPTVGSSVAGLSPGDDFEAHTDWQEILEPHGWRLESRYGVERHWTRPGKSPKDGASATTGRANDRDRLYVFSTSTVFEAEIPYTKFGAWALLNHGGDHHAAARALVRMGFGDRAPTNNLDTISLTGDIEGESTTYTLDEVGNAERLYDLVAGDYHYVFEEREVYCWTGQQWRRDYDSSILREAISMSEEMALKAGDSKVLAKWATTSRSQKTLNATVNLLKCQSGFTISTNDMNQQRHLLNVRNGEINLHSGEFGKHDRGHLITQLFDVVFDPEATCPNFEKFMVEALPSEEMRCYIQRALGYSLLGDADQRSIFLVHGPSGTGKSTLLETIRAIMGDYAATAPAGTFRSPGRDKAPTNDLHQLRGTRFVTTSETAEFSSFDEELLKRISGYDNIRSRALYQEHLEWQPEFTLWIATNHPPKFNSDDDAIWRRVKLIPFTTIFLGEGHVAGYARKVLMPERSGILNWLLDGLKAFQAHGLGEPQEIASLAKEQRLQSDSVARFIDDRVEDGVLMLRDDTWIRRSELHTMYAEWSRFNGERPLTNRRFINRLTTCYPDLEQKRIQGHHVWAGIGRGHGASILGSMIQ